MRLVSKEVLPFMSTNDLSRSIARCGCTAVGIHEHEVCEERGIGLLLGSGVLLLHDCSEQTWEFDVD